jgi:monofunctional biosynthetic peptidoglycan transglycosylase
VLILTLAAAGGVAHGLAGSFSPVKAATAMGGAIVVLSVAAVLALRWMRPPTTAFMLHVARRRRRAGDASALDHDWMAYREIAPTMRLAAIAAEDCYFAFHRGFDWESIRQAHRHNREGRRLRGGSTITQQLAKNLFLWPGRSYLRKALEAYFTVLIEALWPKWRILEVYLNVAQFGPRVFGVAAAARALTGRSAALLTRQEAAFLATLPKNPERYAVAKPTPLIRLRQTLILDSMKRLGPRYLAYVDES